MGIGLRSHTADRLGFPVAIGPAGLRAGRTVYPCRPRVSGFGKGDDTSSMRDGANSVYLTEEEIGQGAASETVSLMKALAFVEGEEAREERSVVAAEAVLLGSDHAKGDQA